MQKKSAGLIALILRGKKGDEALDYKSSGAG